MVDGQDYRFNRLAWGSVDSNRSRGVIAAGMENGELALWDPAKILAGAEYVPSFLESTYDVNVSSPALRNR